MRRNATIRRAHRGTREDADADVLTRALDREEPLVREAGAWVPDLLTARLCRR